MKSLSDPNQVISTQFDFVRKGDSIEAQITQTMNTQTAKTTRPAKILESAIRAGLSAKTSLDDSSLNGAERLVVHAMMMSEDVTTREIFSTGLDLSKVRSAKLYIVEQKAETIGATAVIEAKDQNGAILVLRQESF